MTRRGPRIWLSGVGLVALALALVVPLTRPRPRPRPASPPAAVVAAPAPPRESPVAWVREAGSDARIEVRGNGGVASPGRALHVGDALEAGPAAPVRVGLLDDGASMTLLPGARVRFTREALHVEQGTVRGHAGPARRRPQRVLTAPSVRAFVQDAAYTLATAPGGARLELRQGRAEVVRVPDGARAALTPGQLIDVAPGRPLAPRPLIGDLAGAERLVSFDFETPRARPALVGETGRCPPGRRGRCVAAVRLGDPLVVLGARLTDARGLFAWGDGLVLRFKYWFGERGAVGPPLVVWFGDADGGRMHVVPAGEAVRGRWAEAAIRLSDLDDLPAAGRAPLRGDVMNTLTVGTPAEGEDVFFVDDVQIQRAPR